MATDIQTVGNPTSVYSSGTQSYSSSGTSAGGVVLSKLTFSGVVVPAYQNTSPPVSMPLSVDPNLDGSWAVDTAGNLFVSQSYYDINYNFHGNTFNYLTNGDLSQLLPPAPGSATYMPIGVIH
jgi:hypothetical protein